VVTLLTKGGVLYDYRYIRDYITWARLLAKYINRVSTYYSYEALALSLLIIKEVIIRPSITKTNIYL